MKRIASADLPGLFDLQQPAPLPTVGESRAEFERERPEPGNRAKPTADVSRFAHERLSGRCVKTLPFWTGKVAMEVGPVLIEFAPHLIYVLHPDGRMGYTFSREHSTDLDKFHAHFCLDRAEGGAA
jgi:hypothetical protein